MAEFGLSRNLIVQMAVDGYSDCFPGLSENHSIHASRQQLDCII